MSLLKELREQPNHIKAIFLWTGVVISCSVVGVIWFQSTKQQFISLMHGGNPPEQTDTGFAEAKSQSPFATIKDTLHSMTANISSIVQGDSASIFTVTDTNATISTTPVPPASLPLGSDRQAQSSVIPTH